jgi:hypothetical protein
MRVTMFQAITGVTLMATVASLGCSQKSKAEKLLQSPSVESAIEECLKKQSSYNLAVSQLKSDQFPIFQRLKVLEAQVNHLDADTCPGSILRRLATKCSSDGLDLAVCKEVFNKKVLPLIEAARPAQSRPHPSRANTPFDDEFKKLKTVDVLGEPPADQDGITYIGQIDPSKIANPNVRALARDVKMYRIDTTKVPVTLMAAGPKQQDGTYITSLEATINAKIFSFATFVSYDGNGQLRTTALPP